MIRVKDQYISDIIDKSDFPPPDILNELNKELEIDLKLEHELNLRCVVSKKIISDVKDYVPEK